MPPTDSLATAERRTPPAGRLLSPQAVVDAAERLAAPSPVVSGILRTLDEGAAPARAISSQLAASPELTVHVLRLANSAMFGQRVDSLERAVVRIGERTLRAVLLAASTYRLMEGPLPVYGLPRLALFRHSSEVAETAQTIVRGQSGAYQGQAYLAGLLHDIGKPIIAAATAGRLGPEAALARGDILAEHELLGTDHAQVAGWIATRWSLAPDLAEALQHHHDEKPPAHPVARAVWLADLVVWAGNGDDDAMDRLPDAAQACGIGTDAMEAGPGRHQGGRGAEAPAGTHRPRDTGPSHAGRGAHRQAGRARTRVRTLDRAQPPAPRLPKARRLRPVAGVAPGARARLGLRVPLRAGRSRG